MNGSSAQFQKLSLIRLVKAFRQTHITEYISYHNFVKIYWIMCKPLISLAAGSKCVRSCQQRSYCTTHIWDWLTDQSISLHRTRLPEWNGHLTPGCVRDMQAAVWFFQRGAITAVHPRRRLDYDATLYCGCFVHKVETQEFRSCSGPKLTLSPHIGILIGCWRESMDACIYVGHEVKRHRERTNLFYLFREPFQGQAGPCAAVRVRLTFIDFIVHCSTFHSKVL